MAILFLLCFKIMVFNINKQNKDMECVWFTYFYTRMRDVDATVVDDIIHINMNIQRFSKT